MLLEWAAIFFLLALGAGAFASAGIAEGTPDIAKILFYMFSAICLVLLLAGLTLPKQLRQLYDKMVK